jgi:hypothetical protein
MPPPDLEAVASGIDQTLSLEVGRDVPRTAWAGRPPDGMMDALFNFLPAARARRQLWERGQALWAERMTQALSGPCQHCTGEGALPQPAATIVQSSADLHAQQPSPTPPATAWLPYGGDTAAMPAADSQAAPGSAGDEEGMTSAMPTYVDRPGHVPADEGVTTAMPHYDEHETVPRRTVADGRGAGSAGVESGSSPLPASYESDEHESHTVMFTAPPPSLRTGPRLVVVDGPVHGRQFSLGRALTTLGRSIGCHITIEADTVAYDHARVVRDTEGWKIEPIGGADELYVNEDPVRASRALQSGDVIRIGPARLRFESAS